MLAFVCVFSLVLYPLQEATSECLDTSYVTICDSITDAFELKSDETITDLVIKPKGNETEVIELDLYLFLFKFRDARSIEISEQPVKLFSRHLIQTPPGYKLKYLTLHKNNLRKLTFLNFPKGLHLKKLSLTHNDIEDVEPDAFRLVRFEEINLSNNRIESFEKSLFLGEVKVINAKHNKLAYVEPIAFPSSLEVLNLGYNQLGGDLNRAIRHLVRLEQLILCHNRIYFMPNITTMGRLRVLDLSYNHISTIDGSMFKNSFRLESLNLNHHKIDNLEFLQRLSGTTTMDLDLYLRFNMLKGPESLNIPHIVEPRNKRRLAFYGNPWQCNTWTSLEKVLNQTNWKQNYCDHLHLTSGVVPYCTSDDTITDYATKERFYQVIEKNKYLVSCHPDQLKALCPFRNDSYSCVQGYL